MKKSPSVSTANSHLVKIGQAAKILGVSIDTLRRWDKSGKITSIRTPGGTRLYLVKQLEKVNSGTPTDEPKTNSYDQYYQDPPKPRFDSSQLYPQSEPIFPKPDLNIPEAINDLSEPQIEPELPISTPKPYSFLSHLLLPSIIAAIVGISLIRHSHTPQGNNPSMSKALKNTQSMSGPISSKVLAAVYPAEAFLQINTDTNINGKLTISGDTVITGKILGATNIVSSIVAGNNIAVDSTNPTAPVVSLALPSVVNSVNNISGAPTLKAGTDISIASSSATLTFADTSTLDSVTGRGASTSNALTLSSTSNSITVGTLTASGGSINGTTVGASSASTGAFTTLSTTGAFRLESSSNLLSGSGVPSSSIGSNGDYYFNTSAAGGSTSVYVKISGSWTAAGGGVSGTTNRLAKFDSTGIALANSSISDDGTTVSTTENFSTTGTLNGLTVSSGTISSGTWNGTAIGTAYGGLGGSVTAAGAGELLYSTGTTTYSHLAAGTANYVLVANGAAAPVWTAQSGLTGVVPSFNNITSGTNTQATMTVSTGASLTYSASGTINSSSLEGNTWEAPGTIGSTTKNTGAFTTLTALPGSNSTALTLTGTNVTSSNLATLTSSNTSGNIVSISSAASTTLSGALTGINMDLDSGNLTATNQNVTGQLITLPTVTNTNSSGTETYKGLSVTFGTGSGINQNGAGATVFSNIDISQPALTQTSGTLTANGIKITTPTSITTGGTANGLNISASGVGAGTLNGINISSITAGAGTQTALAIGSGWGNVLTVNGASIINGSGVTQVAGGGTGDATLTQNGVLYGNATSAAGITAAGTTGQVLIGNTGSAPSWGTISGSTCTDCLVTDPSSSQTITPTSATATGLIVKQASSGSVDIFDICANANCTGSNNYFSVDKNGNVSTGAISNTTLTLTPTSDTTALTLVGTNVATSNLQYINSKNSSGNILKIAYGAAQTLSTSTALTGITQDLSTNVTATNSTVAGENITLPSPTDTHTSGTKTLRGLVVTDGGGLNQNGAGGTLIFSGADITIPALTQTAGTITGNGVLVTTPSSITTGGTANGINISASGVGAGTLNGVNISSITAGAGTQTALNIGSGWNNAISANGFTVNGSGAVTAATGITSSGTITFSSMTSGSVLFAGTSGALSQNNSNFYWDNSNTRLGIGTNSFTTPAAGSANSLEIRSSGTNTAAYMLFGNSDASQFIDFLSGRSGDTNARIIFNKNATSFRVAAGNSDTSGLTDLFTVLAGGNVGIGATNPQAGLDVYTTAANGFLVRDQTSGHVGLVVKPKSTGGVELQGTNEQLSATADMALQPEGGNVAIGLASPSYRLDIATSTASDRGINIAHTASTGTNYGVYSSVTGAATTNYGGYYVSTGATTDYGLAVAALTGATSTGAAIGALSGTTANTGVSIGAISGSGATGTGITVGNISSTGTTDYGLQLGTLTGGTTSNYQIQTGNVTAIGSATNAGLVIGTTKAVTGTAASSTNYGININPIDSTGTTNYGINIGAVSGATTNYDIKGANWNLTAAGALTVVSCSGCGAATRLDQITAATSNGSAQNSTNNTIEWDWNSLTTQTAFTINDTAAGGSLTTGTLLALGSTSSKYVHTAAETGSLISIGFSDESTNTSGATTTNGLILNSKINTSGAGTKSINVIDIAAPTNTACTSGACTWTGFNLAAPGALSNTTYIGAAIGALSGTTANTGVSIGAISGSGATGTGITVGNISSTGTTDYGLQLGTLTGGTTSNYQIQTGNVTAIGSATNAGLVIGTTKAVTGTAASSTNYGININPIDSTGTTNYGLYIGGSSGATTNYAQYINATQTGGTIVNIGYGSSATLASALTGISRDLKTNVTDAAQSVTGDSITLPTVTAAAGSTILGVTIGSPGAITNSSGTTTWTGFDVTTPAITQSGGTLTSNGVKITAGTITSGTSNGINLSGTFTNYLTSSNLTIANSGAITDANLNTAEGVIYSTNSSGLLGITAGGTNGQCFVGNTSAAPSWGSCSGSTGWGTAGNSGLAVSTHFVGTTDANGLAFRTNNTEYMRISSGGLVGINQGNNDANYRLDIADATGNGRGINISQTDATLNDTDYGLYSSASGATKNNVAGYFTATNATNNYAIIVPDSAGNVGLGTTTPKYLLTVDKDALGAVTNVGAATNTVTYLSVQNTTASTGSVTRQFSPALDFIGHVWDTTAVADDQTDAKLQLINSSAAVPTSQLNLYFKNPYSNSANWYNLLQISDRGTITDTANPTNAGGFLNYTGCPGTCGTTVSTDSIDVFGGQTEGYLLYLDNSENTHNQTNAILSGTIGIGLDLNADINGGGGTGGLNGKLNNFPVEGVKMILPPLTDTATSGAGGNFTDYGIELKTTTSITSTNTGALTFYGISEVLNNITSSGTGTVHVYGLRESLGSITTQGVQRGIDISEGGITTAGTQLGANIGQTYASVGATTGINIAALGGGLAVGGDTSSPLGAGNNINLGMYLGDSYQTEIQLYNSAYWSNTSGTNQAVGIDLYPHMASTGVGGTHELYGIYVESETTDASSTGTNNIYGVRIANQAASNSSLINNSYGIYIDAQTASSSKNRYNLYMAGTGASANDWSIYSNGAAQSYFNGSIGVGITAPNYKLSIVGAAAADAVHSVINTDGTNQTTNNVMRIATAVANGVSAVGRYVIFYSDATTDNNGTAQGHINMINNGVNYGTSGADFGERVHMDEPVQIGDIVGTINGQNLRAIQNSSLIGVVSDKTGFTGNDLDTLDKASNPTIGMLGQVSTKVDTESGPIYKGDFIAASSTPGVGMKAVVPGQVIGQALQDYSGVGVGKISVYVHPTFADPKNVLSSLTLDSSGSLVIPKIRTASITIDPSLNINSTEATGSGSLSASFLTQATPASSSTNQQTSTNWIDVASTLQSINTTEASTSAQIAGISTHIASQDATIASQSATIASNSAQLASQSDLLSSITQKLNSLVGASPSAQPNLTPPSVLEATSSASLAELNVSDKVSTLNLSTTDATISGTLYGLGDSILGKTTIAGDLTVDGLFSVSSTQGGTSINSLTTLFIQNNPLAQLVDFFSGKVTIDNSGSIKTSSIYTNQLNINSNTSAGTGVITAGQTQVGIQNSYVDQNSVVIITPNIPLSQTPAVTNKNPGKSFTVTLSHAEQSDVNFSYLIVGQK